ncbi:hypothetical protein C8Q76DRAFT_753647 [Earliella scabrosa]|nr:hypothetical protein C8Q76DRAFT_753647 [Earliella scabrosa]
MFFVQWSNRCPSTDSSSQLSPLVHNLPDPCSELSTSTTFHPDAALLHIPVDLSLVSSDGVCFYVHLTHTLTKSTNGFNGLLAQLLPTLDSLNTTALPEPASVLNIVLHAVYNIAHECACFSPGLDTLLDAVDALTTYGIPLPEHLAHSKPLHTLILSQAPRNPIAAYATAAAHGLEDLTVPISSHLLSCRINALPEYLAHKIGSTYLRRLFFLHLGRVEAFRRILRPPPQFHPSTEECDFGEQKKLTRAWSLASGYLAWDARPGACLSSVLAVPRSWTLMRSQTSRRARSRARCVRSRSTSRAKSARRTSRSASRSSSWSGRWSSGRYETEGFWVAGGELVGAESSDRART